ncbi:tRNA1(Val) (adenine(37)-N6)-methyltransferase [Edaphobacillus lindanitolerans]|uniref:tRNA1(Val) A37 N6-methylase TrmN6 n=1 Tax=Edaphobacillus lindanitolerans TaxID=550447 RepID=A0A1U7PNY9_9BACI|nr:tRNA1(Val) (adenine(37)-N6)-methyltransferase [Edaphobacillus lindanitolerans]SIT93412.1 tRNA1(Val) A37 N6-methylase TrmN6 [Edaphobacillus lindanitolerans]
MDGQLEENERLDDLLAEGLKIIQSPEVFSFSLDAVLLAKFAYVPIRKGSVVDLCAGNGAIPLFLSARTKADITAVELQPRLASMAERSVRLNGLDGRIRIIQDDVKGIADRLGHEKHDTVTCNPPYFPAHELSDRNMLEEVAIARHELTLTLDEAVANASSLLKQGGKAAFVHRPGRLLDIVTAMRNNRLEPKRIRFVYPKAGREANTLLIEGTKDGKPDLKILPPLYVYGENGEYTAEVKEMLYGPDV